MAVASYEVSSPGGFPDEDTPRTAREKRPSILDVFHVCPIGGVYHYLEPALARISAEVTAAAQKASVVLVKGKKDDSTR